METWVGVLWIYLLYLIESVLEILLSSFFIIGPVVMSVVAVYALLTNARILGLVYRERKEELAWL